MGGYTPQKLRLMYLAKILYEETDDGHYLTRKQICNRLSEYGFEVPNRETFADDIKWLSIFGIDVVSDKIGKDNHYHITTRNFELAELKTIVDSIQSSRFLTESKSGKLIKKMEAYASRYEAELLNRQVYVSGRIKSSNSAIFYNVDVVYSAINRSRKISFLYFDILARRIRNSDGGVELKTEKVYRHDRKVYVVSPWTLISNNQNYYMVGCEDDGEIKHFRMDRVADAHMVDEPSDTRPFKGMSVPDYAEKCFDMYDGYEERVTLRIEDPMYPIIADRFGRNKTVVAVDDEHLDVTVAVRVSNQFLCWILSLGDKVKIISPDRVVGDMRKLLAGRSRMYS